MNVRPATLLKRLPPLRRTGRFPVRNEIRPVVYLISRNSHVPFRFARDVGDSAVILVRSEMRRKR